MALRYRIPGILSIVLVLGVVSLAIALSRDAPCRTVQPPVDTAERMKAVVYRCYGSADVLRIEELAKPIPADDQVLVKVHAAALNPLDWHYMTGKPYVMRLSAGMGTPNDVRVGVDFAGTVEAVGRNVTRFKPGDAVFGGRSGALGEYVTVREDRALAHKPANVTFEQAAAVPIAALTALQGLRDKGRVGPGHKVLINGASGGVGTFAVQIAKSLGAHVTGVCSTRNVELVRSLGADRVIDYTREDFTRGAQIYDVILDNVGNHPFAAYRRVLQPDGTLVMVGGPKHNRWFGPLLRSVQAGVLAPFVSQELAFFLAELNQEDLKILGDLMAAGQVTPVIDKRYPLNEVAAAMRYLESGRARGKVIVNVL